MGTGEMRDGHRGKDSPQQSSHSGEPERWLCCAGPSDATSLMKSSWIGIPPTFCSDPEPSQLWGTQSWTAPKCGGTDGLLQ